MARQISSEEDLLKLPPALSGLPSPSGSRATLPSAGQRSVLAIIALRKEDKEEPAIGGAKRRLEESPGGREIEPKLPRAYLYRIMGDLRYSFFDRANRCSKVKEDPRIIAMKNGYVKEIRNASSRRAQYFLSG